ncbi:MAG: PH domain-containing protein [Parvularculaceae bacterium]
MGYVRKTLAAGEEYLYRARFNWTYDLRSWMWFLMGCIPGAFWSFGFFRNYFRLDAGGEAAVFFSGAAFMLGAIIALSRYVRKWTTVIAVTSVRLILKTGLVARSAHEVTLTEIEEVLVSQTFLGRILGYGALTVRGTGGARIEFPIVGKPMKVRKEIEEAMARARGADQGANGGVRLSTRRR